MDQVTLVLGRLLHRQRRRGGQPRNPYPGTLRVQGCAGQRQAARGSSRDNARERAWLWLGRASGARARGLLSTRGLALVGVRGRGRVRVRVRVGVRVRATTGLELGPEVGF